jgi:hypothetical protein
LELQYRGLDAFNDAEILKQLSFTDQQRQRLQSLSDQAERERRSIAEAASTNRDQALQRYQQLQQQTWEQTNRILNDAQRRAWSQMTGNRFNFPPTFFPPTGQPPAKP